MTQGKKLNETVVKKKVIDPKSERPKDLKTMAEQRDKLGVVGLGPEWKARWFIDKGEGGERIRSAQLAGWSFVDPTEVESVGEEQIFESEFGGGSIIRRPGNPKTTGEMIYLMKIPAKWFDEAQWEKELKIREQEEALRATATVDGSGVDGMYAPKGHHAGINIRK